ncbi:MAG: spore coat associated protein CotJA [Clostridia bacterium]|nr:spore coat associated protein CotJA [Clostridia bacterium]
MEMTRECRCLGYGYVPIQQLNTVYSAEDALKKGSLFPELVLTIEEYGKVCKGGGKRYDS